MHHAPVPNMERQILRLLLTAVVVFVCWTLAHQVATFAGVSWARLQLVTAWLLVPLVGLGCVWSGKVASIFAAALTETDSRATFESPSLLPTALMVAVAAVVGWATPSYPIRWAMVLGGAALWWGFVWLRPIPPSTIAPAPNAEHQGSTASAWTWLAVFMLIAVAMIVFVNRSDFDDAEYLQLALQTLQYPDKPLYGFDASLGTVIEQFRFAPYRITSYETFVALVSSLGHIDLLDAYYLVLPTLWAALSVAVAFLFLRWFLPRPWALLGVGLFLLIAITWGETHVAFGNRMYVRLFQGKGLLVVLTTPLTALLSLLWMRRSCASTWVALFAMQVMAVGVSSSGIVVTLFATAIGLAAGWLAQPSLSALARAMLGGLVLAYPIGLGLWLKFASNAAGKVEDIGTYLPIEASLGGHARQMLLLATTAVVLTMLARPMVRAWQRCETASPTQLPAASFGWMLVASTVLVLNPFLIGYITEATSRNMNWRLAWAAPVPLMLAASFCFLLIWTHRQRASHRVWAGLLAVGLPLSFAAVDLPTLRAGNNLSWGFWQHKLPPEHADAVALARQIRAQVDLTKPVTLLVEPRVGTWLTVVAPEFRLVMPGHGYRVTLGTVLPAQEMADRARLVDNVGAVVAGDAELLALARRYGVTVVAKKQLSDAGATVDGYTVITLKPIHTLQPTR